MRKRAPIIEWYFTESEADWERLQTSSLPDITLDASRQRHLNRFCWSVVALLLLLASVNSGLWRTDQAALPPSAVNVTATAQAVRATVTPSRESLITSIMSDPLATDWWRQGGQEERILPPTVQLDEPAAHGALALHRIVFQGNQAMVSIITTAKNGAPDATLWGPERSLETPFFIYHFRQNDAPAVIAVAQQVDALYTTLRQNFGLPLAASVEKLAIEVSVTQSPGLATPGSQTADHFRVPSPVVYLAPAELTDAELLAQSIALPLIDQVLAQAREHHTIGRHWQPLVDGLRLWQVWGLDLPLAAWREPVVKWIYVDGPALGSGQTFVLPERYRELCAAHLLWLLSPALLNIPLTCVSPKSEEASFPLQRLRDPLIHLDQLGVPVRPGAYSEELDALHRVVPHPGQTVALATLIDYAVATNGRERLPKLVAGLGQYDSWETLLPAVYGVSPAEFEAGWQAYLAEHYGR